MYVQYLILKDILYLIVLLLEVAHDIMLSILMQFPILLTFFISISHLFVIISISSIIHLYLLYYQSMCIYHIS